MARKITTASAFLYTGICLMVFFYVSFTIKKEDSDFALFKCILFMYPDDLSIQIEWFHTVSGNTDTKICTGSYFISYFYFRESVGIEELAGSG